TSGPPYSSAWPDRVPLGVPVFGLLTAQPTTRPHMRTTEQWPSRVYVHRSTKSVALPSMRVEATEPTCPTEDRKVGGSTPPLATSDDRVFAAARGHEGAGWVPMRLDPSGPCLRF